LVEPRLGAAPVPADAGERRPGETAGSEFGGSGRTSAQLLSEGHVDSVITAAPGWCVVMIGTNDISGATTVATTVANLATIYGKLLAAGIRVMALTITPRTDTDATSGQKIRDVNHWIRSYVRKTRGMHLADVYASILDPATNKALTTSLTDTVHPNGIGGGRIAKVVAAAFDPLVPKLDPLPFDGADVTNLVPNALMTGDVSGAATSLTVYASGTPTYTKSKVARTDGMPGEWQQIDTTVAAAPNSDGVNALWQNTAVGTSWSVGDEVFGAWEFETDPATPWLVRAFALSIICVGGAAPNTAFWAFTNSSERAALPAGQSLVRLDSGVMRTPNFVIPTGTTNVQLQFSIYGTGRVRLGRSTLTNVTRQLARQAV